MTSGFAGSSSCSRLGYAPARLRSALTSCAAFFSRPREHGADPLGVLEQGPVVVPRDVRDREGDTRPHAEPSRTYGVLLGVAPAVPCPLDRRIDQLQPVGVVSIGRRRRKHEQLPLAVLADLGDDRLPTWAAAVPERSRDPRV